MICVQVSGPEYIRDGVSAIKEWQRKSNTDAAVFEGKSTLTQMLELPIRSAYRAMLRMMSADSRSARDKGLATNWLDQEKRWSISRNGTSIIRGKADMQNLEAEVHISLEHFEYTAAEQIIKAMKDFERNDRFGSLLECSYSNVERFQGDSWGRQRKQS